jgi:tRNA nucleotidyltransferase/poly(A) polymerase
MSGSHSGSSVELAAPLAVRWIARTLEEAGHETWAVGGAVRDAILGNPTGDWDLATQAHPRQVRSLFRKTVPIGIDHGTVGVLGRDGTLYEVTTFRKDVQTFGRHAVVEFASTLDEDLSRRDFTINAIAWHPLRGELWDPFGGVEDLQRGVLRTVGPPTRRFAEDYLRILRALRFAGQFGLEIDGDAWVALCEGHDRLTKLSPERVREELMKALAVPERPSATLGLYAISGVLGVLYPELEPTVALPRADLGPGDVWTHGLLTADALSAARPLLRLAAVLAGLVWTVDRAGGAPEGEAKSRGRAGSEIAKRLMERLRFSNVDTGEVVHLVRWSVDSPGVITRGPALRRWLGRVGRDSVPDILRLRIASHRADAARAPSDPVEVLLHCRTVRDELRRRPPLTVRDLARKRAIRDRVRAVPR